MLFGKPQKSIFEDSDEKILLDVCIWCPILKVFSQSERVNNAATRNIFVNFGSIFSPLWAAFFRTLTVAEAAIILVQVGRPQVRPMHPSRLQTRLGGPGPSQSRSMATPGFRAVGHRPGVRQKQRGPPWWYRPGLQLTSPTFPPGRPWSRGDDLSNKFTR